ncbi:hypothetical protein CRM22_000786 [Opisthorchis felineus]|uniref:Uncharacterized protein n=1 Tax=Opisthorchis felineus TaxID=147828 RepID=A0A4S2MDS7_OPIFE|nr:hypothetical protein CRM22_000786 [Opisthorchis felineus]TGZ74732.1 hypothetical protein CRM22_000786 [Opisthorchis felineus]
MFRDGLAVYGPTPTELQGLLERSQQCRRKIRLLQVRNQAKNEAKNIRKKYQLRKKVLEENVAKKLQTAIESRLNEVLDAKVTEYRNYLDNVGLGHVSASLWHDPKIDLDRERRVAHEQAVKRFNVALQAQQTKQELKQQDESEPRLRLAEVRAIEQERAHLVAALPKPAPPPYDLDAPARAPKEAVLVLDAESQNTAAVYTAPSVVLMTTSTKDSSDKTSNESQDAVSAAQMEEDKFLLAQQARSVRTKEELIKADVRGHEALKRERVQQHYRTLLDRMDELSRTEAARLRSEAKMMKPNDEHAVKRRLEKVFEKEILQQLSDTRQQPGNAEFPNSLDYVVHASRPSVWDEMDENAAVSDDLQTSGQTKRGVLTSRENLVQGMRKDADATHIPTPKPFWTAPNAFSTVPIRNDNDSASSGDVSQQMRGTPRTPFISPEAKSLSDPCLTLSFEGNLRPGAESLVHDERSDLLSVSRPSLTSRKESANERDLVSSATHRVNKSPRLRLELDLIRQQALLDEELATIESRLARLRMAAATNAHIRDENLSAESVDEPVPTENLPSVAKQVTPREAYVVEGFAADDNPDKSSRKTPPEVNQPSIITKQPLLKSLPQPCVEQLAALVRAQVSSLRAPVDVPSLTSPTPVSSSSSSLVQSDSVSEVQHSPDTVSDTVSEDVTPIPRRSSSSTGTTLPGDEPLADELSEPVLGFRTDSECAFQRSEPTSLSAVCAPNGSPHILDATLNSRENADAPSNVPLAPRLSLTGLSADERAVLKSVNKLAARLTNVAIHEASKELGSLSVPADSTSIPPLPTSSMTLPPAPSQTGDSKFSPSSSSSSTTTGLIQEALLPTRQPKEINGLEPTGTFSSDSLKAELRSLLTSSLINTLLSQTTDSTISTTGLSGTDVLRRILNSRGNPVTNGASLDLQSTQALHTSSDTANFVGSNGEAAPAAVTSPSSVSPSSPSQHGPVQTTEPIESFPLDENITHPPNHPQAGDELQAPRLSEHESAIKQIKTRVLHEYITVNKDWLLSLAGQNTKLKSFGTASSVSASSSRTCSCSSASFRHLSAADGESDEVHGSPQDIKTDSALSASTTATWNGSQHQATRSQPSTPIWHSSYTAFKPLPRLEEATSEESVQDSLTHLPVLAENANAVVDASRTPSSSWSGSRRSASEFAALSRCSTSNSNLEPARPSTPVPLGSTENSPGSCLSSSVERKSTSEDTTLHQLRNRVPSTPAEPQEVQVVPCLGSNMSSASSHLHPDSLIRELLESGEDNSFWLLNQPPPARPSYQTEYPPGLAAQTRTTTTIDSSLVWDEMEGDGSKEHLSSQPLVASSDPKVIPSEASVHPISNRQPGIPSSPTKEPRPSTPAEGATARGPSDRDLPPMFQSLPTVFVDCESDSLMEVHVKKAPFSRNLPVYASWSNFNRFQPWTDIVPSISDSLRSFQQHEKSCLLADDPPPAGVHVEAPTHQAGGRGQRKFLDWKPDQIDSNMVRQNARAIKAVTIPLSKPRALATAGRITASRGTTAKARKTSARAQTIPVESTPALQGTRANSDVLTRRTRTASVSVYLRKKTRFRRPSVSARTSFPNVRKPAIADNPKMEPSSSRVNRQQETSRKPYSHDVEKCYVHGPPPETRPTLLGAVNGSLPSSSNSVIPTNSKSVEHVLLQQLGQWRAARFGLRSRTDPHITSRSSAFSTANGWSSQFQSAVSVAVSEHVDFSAIHPGPPPPVVERSFMDDPSSTVLWFNEDHVPATLVQRPSTPTPAETGRPSTSSEEYSTVPYQLGSSGRDAIPVGFMDYHGVEIASAACAGDEVPVKRRHGTNEVRFVVPDPHDVVRSGSTASQSHNGTQPHPLQSAHRANPTVTGHAIQVPNLASRAQQPNDTLSATVHASSVDVARSSVYKTNRRKQRDELARQNRLRMKEFDQARRERLFRRSKKRTDR